LVFCPATAALSKLISLGTRISQHDKYIARAATENSQFRQLMQLGGIGPTTASASVATAGNGRELACGRQFCAWLGLVPDQYSSGGKQHLGRITKAGNRYLRTLLILDGKAVWASATNKTDALSRWAISVGVTGKSVVPIAAKTGRMCWTMLQRGAAFQMPA